MILGITMKIHTLVYVWHGPKYLLTYKNKFIYIYLIEETTITCL